MSTEFDDKAVQRGFDLVASAPGPHPFGRGAPSDEELVRVVADLIALQRWRQSKGLSLLTPHRILAEAVVASRGDVTDPQPEHNPTFGELSGYEPVAEAQS